MQDSAPDAASAPSTDQTSAPNAKSDNAPTPVLEGEHSRILKWPHPILSMTCRTLQSVETADIERIAEMLKIADEAQALGLAAPQVGWTARVFVTHGMAVINPKIIRRWGAMASLESCLSVPGLRMNVRRSKGIEVEFRTLDAVGKQVVLIGEMAAIFQHEIDHLNGITIVDKLTEVDLIQFKVWHNKSRKEREFISSEQ